MQGRVAKTVNQRALLEQAYIKDSGKTVGEVVKEAIAGIGENIKIRRFERCAKTSQRCVLPAPEVKAALDPSRQAQRCHM